MEVYEGCGCMLIGPSRMSGLNQRTYELSNLSSIANGLRDPAFVLLSCGLYHLVQVPGWGLLSQPFTSGSIHLTEESWILMDSWGGASREWISRRVVHHSYCSISLSRSLFSSFVAVLTADGLLLTFVGNIYNTVTVASNNNGYAIITKPFAQSLSFVFSVLWTSSVNFCIFCSSYHHRQQQTIRQSTHPIQLGQNKTLACQTTVWVWLPQRLIHAVYVHFIRGQSEVLPWWVVSMCFGSLCLRPLIYIAIKYHDKLDVMWTGEIYLDTLSHTIDASNQNRIGDLSFTEGNQVRC